MRPKPPTISEIAATAKTITVRCPDCGRHGTLNTAEIAAKHGGQGRAMDLAERMVCTQCGRRRPWLWFDYPSGPAFEGYPRW
jgi:hypothetical protein